MISTNGRQGDGVLEFANSGRVKGVEVGSAYNDTGTNSYTHKHSHTYTRTQPHTPAVSYAHMHAHLHSAMRSWLLRLVLYSLAYLEKSTASLEVRKKKTKLSI